MSGPGSFVARWSRLKRESDARREQVKAAGTRAIHADAAPETEASAAPTFDVARLPAIDAITANTDVSVFLQSGVPAKLTEAALRRAWVSDPLIRDFIEIAENQWDFTNPTTIPGFGALPEMVGRLAVIAQVAGTVGGSLDDVSAGRPADIDEARRVAQAISPRQAAHHELSTAASPDDGRVKAAAPDVAAECASPRRRRRRHGGALPR